MTHAPAPYEVRQVEMIHSLQWLALAWKDIERCPYISVAHGLVLAVFGALLAVAAYDRFWFMAGAFSGFLVVAPVLAAGLYALSRALERGEPANLALVWRTWTVWRNDSGETDTRMVRFGLLLALAGTGWMLTSAALITWLSPQVIHNPIDFAKYVILAPKGYLFEIWLAMGGLLAAPLFASSAVAMPMLLDQRCSVMQAVLTSWQAVLANPIPMAIWAGLIMGFTLLGLGSMFLGLLLVIPMLGHASWHAYRDLVVTGDAP